MAKWYKVPPESGVYYRAKNITDWDICEVCPVETIIRSNGEIIRRAYSNHIVLMEGTTNWINVSHLVFKDNIWFGPLEKLTQPKEII